MSDLNEIKSLLDEQGKAFAAFRAANDERLAQVEKRGEDAVTVDAVAKLNAELDRLGDALKAAEKRSADMELRINRPGAPGDGGAAEAKSAAEMTLHLTVHRSSRGLPTPAAFSVDEYRAYKSAFLAFARGREFGDEIKALSTGSDPDGGYLVPADMTGRIVQKVYESSPIRQIAAVQAISSDALEGGFDADEAASGWVGETAARTETTSPTVGKWRIPVYECYAAPKATQRLLDDAAVNVEAWLEGKIADKLARAEATAFVAGTGIAQPRGFTTYTTAATADATRARGTLEHVATGSSGSFGTAPNGSDKLIDLVHKLKASYRAGATWVMNRSVVGKVRQLKAGSGNDYIWLPSMVSGQPASLLGYPVVEAEDMDDLGANSLSIAFGDFGRGYQIVDRVGVRTLRDPYTDKPNVIFYSTRRVGGDVVDFDAIKFLKFI